MVTEGRKISKPAAVSAGCQTRTRHSICASKWVFKLASSAVATSSGSTAQRTGAGAVCW